jgi:hypothetical protein
LLAVDDILLADLHVTAHIQREIKLPVALFGTAAQQAHIAGQSRGCVAGAAPQTRKYAFFLHG